MRFLRQLNLLFLYCCVAVVFGSCMRWDYGDDLVEFDAPAHGLFIVSEGNFQYGNSSLSFYDPATCSVENDIFFRANGMKLGDVAQYMTVYDGKGWIVVNNSHVIFAIGLSDFREKGRIENLTSPRYIHFISPEKAYVTQLWDNRIFIVNPRTYKVTGYIEVPGMAMENGSTEQMVQLGRYVYCTCWSYQNRIIRIDTETDTVTGQIEVGIQPRYLVKDCRGKLWVLTDGGLEGSPYGHEAPALLRVDPENFTVEARFDFDIDSAPADLQVNGTGDELFWIDGDVWRMSVGSSVLPRKPFLEFRETKYYALTVDPLGGEVYVADAIDYMQPGMVFRYSDAGDLIDEFYVGVTPGAFCWK